MHRLAILSVLLVAPTLVWAESPKVPITYAEVKDIPYRTGDSLSDYSKQRCRLDVVHPVGLKDFPTVVWFHGGGLKAGERSVPLGLKEKGRKRLSKRRSRQLCEAVIFAKVRHVS